MNPAMTRAASVPVPLPEIRPNPHHPRRAIPETAIRLLAYSMAAAGQRAPLVLRPLSPEERALDPGKKYEIVGGQARYLACLRLGWKEVRAEVRDLSPEKAFEAALLDNRGGPMYWLDRYLAIEKLLEWRQDLTQKDVAERFDMAPQAVGRALKLAGLLSRAAREMIYRRLVGEPEPFELSEESALELLSLRAGEAGDQARVEEALAAMMDGRLGREQSARLVEWMRKGRSAASFAGPDAPGPGGQAEWWRGLPASVKVRRAGKGWEVRWKLKDHEAPVALYAGLAALKAGRAGRRGKRA